MADAVEWELPDLAVPPAQWPTTPTTSNGTTVTANSASVQLPNSFVIFNEDGETAAYRNTTLIQLDMYGDDSPSFFELVDKGYYKMALFDPNEAEDEEQLEIAERNLHKALAIIQAPGVTIESYPFSDEPEIREWIAAIPRLRAQLNNEEFSETGCNGWIDRSNGNVAHAFKGTCPVHGQQ